jgi:hypothetical protein
MASRGDFDDLQVLAWLDHKGECRGIRRTTARDRHPRDRGKEHRRIPAEVEFATIMWFDNLDAVKAFGGDHEMAHVPAAARAMLSRFDERVAHYEVFDRREQKG